VHHSWREPFLTSQLSVIDSMQLLLSLGSVCRETACKSIDGHPYTEEYGFLVGLGARYKARMTNLITICWVNTSLPHIHTEMWCEHWVSRCCELESPITMLSACLYGSPFGQDCRGLSIAGNKKGSGAWN
jgi:hypothetical protein